MKDTVTDNDDGTFTHKIDLFDHFLPHEYIGDAAKQYSRWRLTQCVPRFYGLHRL
jgi:hypothetical protein